MFLCERETVILTTQLKAFVSIKGETTDYQDLGNVKRPADLGLDFVAGSDGMANSVGENC